MRFPYLLFHGHISPIPRPLVPVRYKYKNSQTGIVMALLDSGADYSFASLRVALELGVNLKGVKPKSIAGFGGSKTECFPKQILVEIGGRDILLTVYFGGSLPQEFLSVLGQETLFDSAKISFERYKQSFRVEWKKRK